MTNLFILVTILTKYVCVHKKSKWNGAKLIIFIDENENRLDMEATALKEHEYNVVKIKNVNLLTMAAIYGANASGKSNVLQAFEYMKNMILINNDSMEYSQIKEENIYSFMMNKDPISLEVEILSKDGKIYKYGFESLNDKIKSEWMYEKKINKFYTIFERK